MTVTETRTAGEQLEELHDWLTDNWDPELTVGEWWERLGMAGWAAPSLPVNAYGRGLSRPDAMQAARIIATLGALGAPLGMGISMVSPTIATHGTPEQIDRFIPDAVTGRLGWCQLFSEPGAGSDLAGLQAKAVKDGDVWIINGQKVWTSGGHMADMGMLLARTNPTAPKHQGISWFAFSMHQPGVEVRPLKEMTGHTMFSEVFFTDAVVNDDSLIGTVNDGWTVANTTLFHERSGMGAGGGGGAGGGRGQMTYARAGTIASDLERRAGDFVAPRRKKTDGSDAPRGRISPATMYINLAREQGRAKDPVIRQLLAQAHTFGELLRMGGERAKAVRARGGEIPAQPNFSKLLTANLLRLNRDLGMQLLGARGMLHAYTDEQRATLKNAPLGSTANAVTAQALGAQALPIFGGTDQIQRNIIGERGLGLPKEPGDLSRLPFNEIPKNG